MKYIRRQRRHVYDGKKGVYIFLDKHVKSEKEGHVLWYKHSIGEWETCQKNATVDPVLFGITTKKTSP